MRVGFGVSIAAHAAALAFGLIAFPEARPFAVDDIEALPVDLVELSDRTDLKRGDKKAEKKPDEAPQPKPNVKAEQPSPKAAEKPAEKPVEAAREPAPKPVRDVAKQPKPEPPKPEAVAERPKPAPPAAPPRPQQLAALPEAAEPAPVEEPKPEVPETAPTPRQRPKPPAPPAAAKPEPAKPKPPETQRAATSPEPPTPAKPQFNPDDIAALLDKQQPAGGGDPMPLAEPQTLGSIEGRDEAAMTQSELEALKARLYQCWNPPVGVREAANLVVTIRISLLQDGSLAGPPQVVEAGYDPLSQVAAESAMRAVAQCSPFGDILSPETYAVWRELDFVFDPREMLGG